MDADDDQASTAVGVVELCDLRQRPNAIDAAVRPEIDQDDFAAQVRDVYRTGVEPVFDADKVWCRPAGVGQYHRRADLAFIGAVAAQWQAQQTRGGQYGSDDHRSNTH